MVFTWYFKDCRERRCVHIDFVPYLLSNLFGEGDVSYYLDMYLGLSMSLVPSRPRFHHFSVCGAGVREFGLTRAIHVD